MPQFKESVLVSTQPLVHIVLPCGQTHWLALQKAPGGHTSPHMPQLLGEAVRSVSHPFAGFRSQSANPWLHAWIWHDP
jgi:hypothetical protein